MQFDRLMTFGPARANDVAAVAELYKSVTGLPGCTWNNNYPTVQDAQNDFSANCLYVLRGNDSIIGAVSVVPENELDNIVLWHDCSPCREIARLAVAPEHQGHGYGKLMLQQLFCQLEHTGVRAIHLLVAQCNPAAIRTYTALGFTLLGKCKRYDTDFYIAEKLL